MLHPYPAALRRSLSVSPKACTKIQVLSMSMYSPEASFSSNVVHAVLRADIDDPRQQL